MNGNSSKNTNYTPFAAARSTTPKGGSEALGSPMGELAARKG